MLLVVGLGNPGSQYEHTRHNVGFRVVDSLLDAGRRFSPVSKSFFMGDLYKADDALFLKPSTYMNLSGTSVQAVMHYYKPERLLVVHDDLDLAFGAVRLKRGGGHGGHNGLRSLDQHLGADYCRLRVGIGRPTEGMEVADYVLARFSLNEEQLLQKSLLPHLRACVEAFLDTRNPWDAIVARYSLKATADA